MTFLEPSLEIKYFLGKRGILDSFLGALDVVGPKDLIKAS